MFFGPAIRQWGGLLSTTIPLAQRPAVRSFIPAVTATLEFVRHWQYPGHERCSRDVDGLSCVIFIVMLPIMALECSEGAADEHIGRLQMCSTAKKCCNSVHMDRDPTPNVQRCYTNSFPGSQSGWDFCSSAKRHADQCQTRTAALS